MSAVAWYVAPVVWQSDGGCMYGAGQASLMFPDRAEGGAHPGWWMEAGNGNLCRAVIDDFGNLVRVPL